ncbi:sodium-coupled monocarboxylate transporter 1-like [Oratosquilla oratoria]|uniref:sodium-coupled monocarboxylate transporter 1-like n=1 Tax=Oratosquilla oratoria TaxID=337810 RepID=UPI003F766E5C
MADLDPSEGQEPSIKTFTTGDYIVFGGVLFLSLFLGLYHAFKARNKTNAEFLMGSYNLTCFPVAMSMLATYISAILVLGGPAESYYHGLMLWTGLGALIGYPVVAVTFLPLFYKLRVVSVYEYLELRYASRVVRLLGGGTFVIQIILYLSVVTYAPALALSSVLGFPVWASIVLVGVIGTIYTALGGMRAVVWTDVLQMLVLMAGLMAIIIMGIIEVGNPQTVLDVVVEKGRTGYDYFNWNFSFYERHTVPNILLSGIFMKLTSYGCHQTMVQRYNSMKSIKHAYIALFLNAPLHVLLVSLAMIAGVVLLAVYKDCDPLAAGYITKKDQILPYFVVDRLGNLPGFAGLFVACLFSGALSTLSSGLNSLAAVLWEDVFSRMERFAKLSPDGQAWTSKSIAIFFGMLCMGLSFSAGRLGGVLQASYAVNGAVAGPLLALFVMALFIPFVNGRGAALGLMSGHAVSLFVTFGAMTLNVKPVLLPTSVEGCPANLTIPEPKPVITAEDIEYPWKFLAMSYTLYCPLGFVVATTVGCIASLLLRCKTDVPPDKSLIHPWMQWAIPGRRATHPQDQKISKYGEDEKSRTEELRSREVVSVQKETYAYENASFTTRL